MRPAGHAGALVRSRLRDLRGSRSRIAQIKSHLVAANSDQVAMMERCDFDPLAVDKGTRVARQILEHKFRSAALKLGMTRCDCGITEQSDVALLGATNDCYGLLQTKLASAQPSRLYRQPGGLGQLLNQADKQTDHQADCAQPEQSGEQAAAGQRADSVKGDSTQKPARHASGRTLEDIRG